MSKTQRWHIYKKDIAFLSYVHRPHFIFDLFAVFIDFEKAFDKVWRDGLWYKLLLNHIDGKMYNIIYQMYQGIKSRIVLNGNKSEYFLCQNGLRQGENLSPFLFSLYLNDLEQFLSSSNVNGVSCINDEIEEKLGIYLKLFFLLYADDTILLSDTFADLQLQLNVFHDYCSFWKLKVNIEKTKAVIFSRAQLPQNQFFCYGDQQIEYVTEFNYLGVIFSKNGSFTSTLKNNVRKANIAMYEVLSKGRSLNLSVSCQYDLFEKIVKPILLYGCEVWGLSNTDILERVHLKFCKLLLNLKKSTPSFMVYGELGAFPLDVFIKQRIVNYWSRILQAKENKYTNVLYRIMYVKFQNEDFRCPWLKFVKNIFDNCGLSNVWYFQGYFDSTWVSNNVKRILCDQFIQKWKSEVDSSPKSLCYRIFKENFEFENYLDILENKDRVLLCRYRTCNHRLPIETGRWTNIDRNERYCLLCNSNKIGDEYNYILECQTCMHERKKLLGDYYCNRVNTVKFKMLFQSKNCPLLKNTCKFIKYINTNVSSIDQI